MTDYLAVMMDLTSLPVGTGGFLEWCSGIVRINATNDQLVRLLAKMPDPESMTSSERVLTETLTHETIHFLQICSMGFLYQFAVQLLHDVMEVLPSDPHELFTFIYEPPGNAIRRLTPSARARIEAIDSPTDCGLTIRGLVESHAFYAQKRHHLSLLTSDLFDIILKDAPGEEYCIAYLIARERLGDRAFTMFPVLAALALCTVAPQTAFINFCDAASSEQLPASNDKDGLAAFFNVIGPRAGCEFYGFAHDAVRAWDVKHPVYTAAVEKLVSLPEAPAWPLPFFMDPQDIDPKIFGGAIPVMLLNESDEGKLMFRVFENSWCYDTIENLRSKLDFWLLLFAMGARVLRSHS